MVTPFDLAEGGREGLSPWESASLVGARTLASAWNVAEGVGNFEPYTAMIPSRAWRYRLRAGLVKQLPGVGMWGVGWVVVPGRPERATEMNLPPPYEVAAADPALPAFLVRVPHRERAYLAKELASVDWRRAMEFALDDRSAASDRSVVEGEVSSAPGRPNGVASIVRDEPGRLEVEVRSDSRALLVVNDTLAPGWTASVDGRPAGILPANYLARGVWVEEGTHAVAFAYHTPMLREGWAVACAGALALGIAAVARSRRRPA